MSEIDSPETCPEKWIAEAEKLVPYNYIDRVQQAERYPPYQRHQYNEILSLISRTQYASPDEATKNAFLNSHTFNRADLPRFFESPQPAVAARLFPQLPFHRREQWFDLLLHHTIGALLLPEAMSVKRCFSRETRLLRHFRHNHPCHGMGLRYQQGWNHWKDKLNKTSEWMGYCTTEKEALRHAMLTDPDWDRSKFQYDKFLYCVNTNKHQENILGHMRREKYTPVETDKRPHWMAQNWLREIYGEYGPRSGTSFHSQEEADAAQEEYLLQIQPLTTPVPIQDANGSTVAYLP